jgi:F-type H+-transporting ATPase subunit b
VTALSAISGLAPTPTFRLLAAGGVVMDIDRTMLVQSGIFIMLILVLSPLLFKPVLRLLEERERRTEGARAEARNMQDRAENLLQRYQAKLEDVRRVAAEERERLRSESLRLESTILDDARAATAKFVQEGRVQIEREVGKIRHEMAAHSQAIAREIGSKVLGREVAR